MGNNTVVEAYSEGLERVKKRLPRFMEWLESNWEDARQLEVRASGKYDWLVDGDTPMVDDYTIEGGHVDDPRHTIWMIIGLGTGKALQRVLEKAGRHVARILLVEDDPAVWKCAMVNSQLRQIMVTDDRVYAVWDVEEINSVCNAAVSNLIMLGSLEKTLFFLQKGQADRSPEKPKKIVHAFTEFARFSFSALGNSAEDTLTGFTQIIRNYPNLLNTHSLNDLEGKFSDYAAIIVSAGPSLEKNVHLLKDVQDKCIIICVDTILRKLLNMGITPHFNVAIERNREVYDYHFCDLPENTDGVLPVISAVCIPEVCGTWKGPFIMPFKTLPLDQWFSSATGLPMLQSGSSCAHMGIPLAIKLGCRKIALIGQDLAYSPDGKTHSKGTAWDDKRDRFDSLNKEVFNAPAVLGGTVKTTKIWHYFKTIFEQMIAANKNAEFFDATEGGILIEGTKILPLKEFLENEVHSKNPFVASPMELLGEQPLTAEEKREGLKSHLLEASESLTQYLEVLDELEKQVRRTSSPGFSTARRRSSAFEVATVLDRLVRISPIMTFILQAHIAGCARVVNDSKFLDTPEEMAEWRRELNEFTGTARVACSSAKGLLETMIGYIDEEPGHRSLLEELNVSEGRLSAEQAEQAWVLSKERDLHLFPFTLFSRFDFREGQWTLRNTLQLGRRALELGFVERARKLLSSLLQNEEITHDPSFWNDLALSYCLYEFSIEPDFERARTAFIKAMELDPHNEERSRNYLAMEHMLQKRAEAAYRLFPKSVGKNAAAALGRSWFSVGKRERAIEWFRRALEMAGDDDAFRGPVEKALSQCLAPPEQEGKMSGEVVG